MKLIKKKKKNTVYETCVCHLIEEVRTCMTFGFQLCYVLHLFWNNLNFNKYSMLFILFYLYLGLLISVVLIT